MQFGPEPPLLQLVIGFAPVREEKLRRRSFTRLVDRVRVRRGEGGKVDRVTVELQDRGIAAVLLLLQHGAVVQDQVALPVDIDGVALIGEVDLGFARLAPVLDEEPFEHAPRPALAEMEGDAVVELSELALLHHVGDEVAPHPGDDVAQFLEARGHHHDHHHRDEEADAERQGHEGPQQSARRHPRRRHHDQLGIAVQLVQGVDRPDEQGHGCDHHDQRRQRQSRNEEEDEQRLPLGGHEVELAQGLSNPDRAGEAQQAGQRAACRDPEDVAFDLPHRRKRPTPWFAPLPAG